MTRNGTELDRNISALLMVTTCSRIVCCRITDMGSTFPYDDEYNSPTSNLTVGNCSNSTDHRCGGLNEADYIRSYLGWRYRGLCESVLLTIVYTMILLTGVVGNVSTCVVVMATCPPAWSSPPTAPCTRRPTSICSVLPCLTSSLCASVRTVSTLYAPAPLFLSHSVCFGLRR